MKISLTTSLACSALALSLGIASATAQDTVSASSADKRTSLWFVELAGKPTADGASLKSVQAEQSAFSSAARKAGAQFKVRRTFSSLFNGYSVEVDAKGRAELARLPGVKALYPVEIVSLPPVERNDGGSAPDLATAIGMTGADIAQSLLGLDGTGVRVAVMDTGIDYDHPDLGGCFGPGCRVEVGTDFVGDAFDGSNIPVPDPDPDDCNAHGTHVAGIVGADGAVTGVAPNVTFGAYRVFGCTGFTTADIMIAAMEAALADDMDILNMSIGSAFQWPNYPTAVAASRLTAQGMIVVASIGNNGANGLYAAGAPGVGKEVIGVASFDNVAVTLPFFTVSPDATRIGYSAAAGAPLPPTMGDLPMARTGTTTTTNDACAALAAGSLTGQAALIRRGTCAFHTKALNAMNAGAAAVVLYNNVPGRVNPTVAGTPAITIPVVAVSDTEGALIDGRIAAGATTMTWTDDIDSFPSATGGLISAFSSFGLAADLSFKPDIGAPGGNIFSTIPLEQGGHASFSGTSMSSPHVAGSAALVLEHRPTTKPRLMATRLQNSADPANWFGNPTLGLLDNAHRQGAGMVDVPNAALSNAYVTPSDLALGESAGGPATRTLTINNRSNQPQIFDLGHEAALATGPSTFAPTFLDAPSTVDFDPAQVPVPAKSTATFDVTISPNAGLATRSLYGGYITLTPQLAGTTLRVPFAGFVGDYQSIQVLTPTVNGFPWLAKLIGPNFVNQPAGATYTLVGDDIPFYLVHLDHQSRRMKFEVWDNATGRFKGKFGEEQYLPRNSGANTFFAFEWDGSVQRGGGSVPLPDGTYVVRISVLKALGDEWNPAHWEFFISPLVTIDRP